MYEGKDNSLYVLVNNAFYPCRVSVSPAGTEVAVIGDCATSRPAGATPTTVEEVIARHGLTDGGEYPVAQHTPQAASAQQRTVTAKATVAQPKAVVAAKTATRSK